MPTDRVKFKDEYSPYTSTACLEVVDNANSLTFSIDEDNIETNACLSISQIQQLIKHLQLWLETGELEEKPKKKFVLWCDAIPKQRNPVLYIAKDAKEAAERFLDELDVCPTDIYELKEEDAIKL